MVRIIKGATVKEDPLLEFLMDLMDQVENDNIKYKKRKTNDRSSSRVYPTTSFQLLNEYSFVFTIPKSQVILDATPQYDAKDFVFNDQSLTAAWNYINLGDSMFASLSICSNFTNRSLVEYECMLSSNYFEEGATVSVGSDNQLFMAMAYAAHEGLIESSNIKLVPCSTAIHVYIDLYYSMKPEHRSKATALITTLSRSLPIKSRGQPLQQAINKPEIQPTKPQMQPKSKPLPKSQSSSQNQSQTSTRKQPLQEQPSVNKEPFIKNEPLSVQTPSEPEDESMITQRQFEYAQSQSFASPSKKLNANDATVPIPANDSIEAFYRYLQPPVHKGLLTQYVSDKMKATLTPFQTQNIEWMVSREGHFATTSGIIKPDPEIFNGLPLLYAGTHTDMETGDYVNVFNDEPTTDRAEISQLIKRSYKGGLLADEMGLGKTVSVLGLLTKHIYDTNDPYHPKQQSFPNFVVSKATLIITPGSIIQQWLTEIEKHAPSLKVFVYQGRRAHRDLTSDYFNNFDVVLTHYEAFKSEIHYAKPRPKRPRRTNVEYKNSFKRSPLVTTLWFRCILDEAQMVEAPLTSISSVAKLIPSWYSWAVTGTPMKDRFTDLYGLYDFLDLEDTFNQYRFNNFCDPRNREQFLMFMKKTIRRNMKAALKDQIFIPKQSRHVVRIPFTTIEQHHYDDLWRNCRQALKLDWLDSINWTLPADADEATVNDYNTAKQKMRAWLIALRQNCVHPAMIGNNLMRINGTSHAANNTIQTLDEVLNNMAYEAKIALNNHRHTFYYTQLRIGGMFEVLNDWENAKNTYEANLEAVESLTNNLAERNQTAEKADSFEKQIAVILNRWQFLLHQYYFYMAGIYHRLELQDLEDLFYNKAADVRRILLEAHTAKVKLHTTEMQKASAKVKPSDDVKMGARNIDSSFLDGITYDDEVASDDEEDEEESGSSERATDINTMENVKHVGAILDNQYNKILYLREKIIPMLTKSLVDSSDEEVTGDEYENSLMEQELCQIYLSAYQTLLNDRRFIVKGTFVGTSDVNSVDNGEFVSKEGKRIESVEKAFRQALRFPRGFKLEYVKDVEFSLRTIKNRFEEDSETYKLLTEEGAHLKANIPIQTKLLDDLDVDFKKLNELFNSRVAYYKYLQHISDTLLEWQHSDPAAVIRRLQADSIKQEELISQSTSRDHYLEALFEEHKSMNDGKERKPKDCLICQEPIEKGMITYCGHTSCLTCGYRWFKSSQRCHTCNSKVRFNEWYNISYKKIEMHDKEVDVPSDKKLQDLITEINKEKIIEGKGAKLDSIIRHIQHIKKTTNGKCIVFSQWTKALDMLKHGLSLNNIKFTSINAGAALNKNNVMEFQRNPDINVILLHARSQSSGLTLVAAHTVFIVEPVINESLEKQAINRIHRIGQTKETSVFWYIVQDTIEERIQAIHDMKRNQEHQSAIEAKKQELSKISEGGGEYVDNEDLRRCFTSDNIE